MEVKHTLCFFDILFFFSPTIGKAASYPVLTVFQIFLNVFQGTDKPMISGGEKTLNWSNSSSDSLFHVIKNNKA